MANERKNKEQGRESLAQYMQNPRAFTLKKWLIQLLNTRYTKHDSIVERVALALSTEKDLKDFGSLIAEVFEAGYFKAVNDYKEQAAKAGMEVKIVTPKPTQLS